MKVEKVVVGSLEENCYLIMNEGHCLIVDPGDEAEKILAFVSSNSVQVEAVLITHGHFDHIGALEEVVSYYGVPVLHKEALEAKDYDIECFHFSALFTPGHSSDSVSYYFKNESLMFVGDFVFQGSIGRTDLPTGNMDMMNQSLEKLKQYPIDTVLYPGHGPKTTLDQEIKCNSFFRK